MDDRSPTEPPPGGFATRLSRIVAVAVGVLATSGVAAAHVEYVSDEEGAFDASFVIEALSEPVNAIVIGASGLAVVAVAIGYLSVRPLRRDVEVFRSIMREYTDLLPWLLRLGFGLPLVGAGFAGYLFNPIVHPGIDAAVVRLFQILVGFLLLFGLATRAAAAVGLLAYIVALPAHPALLFSFEYVPGFAAILLVGSGRPSADQVLARVASAEGTFYGQVDPIHRVAVWLDRRLDPYEALVPTVVRVGTGLAFAGLGLGEKLFRPGPALETVERYGLAELAPIPPELWVVGAGLTEFVLGVVLIAGLFTRASALVALAVFTTTLFALPDDPVLAHIGLFSLASVLLITGSGPYALDRRLGAVDAPREPAPAGSESA